MVDSLDFSGLEDAVYVSSISNFPFFKHLSELDTAHFFLFDNYLVTIPKINPGFPDSVIQKFSEQEITKDLPETFESLTDLFRRNESNIILVSAKDDASKNLSREFKDYLTDRGSGISNIKYRDSYLALIADNKILVERMSSDSAVEISLETKNLFKNSLIQKKIEIWSAGLRHGSTSSIKVDGENFSPNLRGMNIVVLDHQFEILEIANYDTFNNSDFPKIYSGIKDL